MDKGYKRKIWESKLLAAFSALILIIVCTGIIGIIQIQNLSQRIERLGKHNLKLEKAVQEMKINNAVYATGIRNYVFWKVSHYLGAVSMAVDLNNVFTAGENFRKHLKEYENNAIREQQRAWGKTVEDSFNDLIALGRHIVDLVDNKQEGRPAEDINNVLMLFENRLYKLDSFLDNTIGRDNFLTIENEVAKTQSDKKRAILFLLTTLFSAVAVGSFIAVSISRRLIKERLYRQKLFNQMMNIEENERKILSAEIHDQMGQDLSALKISLGLIEQKLVNEEQGLKDRLEQAKGIASRVITMSHNIAYLLRPPALDEVGLVESIEELLMEYKHLVGINYTYHKPEEELSLLAEYSLLFYRISQELLTNMAKHSHAKNVTLGLKKNKNSMELYYADDGVGFRYEEVTSRLKRRKEDKFKLGLLGLQERVELLDGLMRVDTAPGKGTRIFVKIEN